MNDGKVEWRIQGHIKSGWSQLDAGLPHWNQPHFGVLIFGWIMCALVTEPGNLIWGLDNPVFLEQGCAFFGQVARRVIFVLEQKSALSLSLFPSHSSHVHIPFAASLVCLSLLLLPLVPLNWLPFSLLQPPPNISSTFLSLSYSAGLLPVTINGSFSSWGFLLSCFSPSTLPMPFFIVSLMSLEPT